MRMINVESSNINSVGFDKETLTLRVKFKSGLTYEYSPVSPELFALLISAESVGKFFNTHIKSDINIITKKL